MSNIPMDYGMEDLINASYNPSWIHPHNNAISRFYAKYLLEKVYSRIKFDNVPETWSYNYFMYVILINGFISFVETKEYGVIPQQCTLGGRNVFYQPSYVNIRNPLLTINRPLLLGEETELIKLQPNYSGVMDIVNYYADMMSICAENALLNISNSKLAYVFTAQNKSTAESFKKMYDQIFSGSPVVVQDRKLLTDTGENSWSVFSQNLSQNYIADRILNDMTTIENKFNNEIGIPNANTMKRERLITEEVNANNIDTTSKVLMWIDTMKQDVQKVNKMFNLNLDVRYNNDDAEMLYSMIDRELDQKENTSWSY